MAFLRGSPQVPVLIIGGGINGIGVFRDLALQGVEVLLVERGDFCSGASAASSHMIHGGIRYLENGEFRLVREAVAERNRLLRLAPHLVRPLATVVPIFKWTSGILNAPLRFLKIRQHPAERGALVIKLGLLLYDALTRSTGGVPRHTFLARAKSLSMFPDLNPQILCTALYYDAAMPSPERLALEVLVDGLATSANVYALNYVEAVSQESGWVLLRETISGETFRVQPKIVINAGGPWIDQTNAMLGAPTKIIGGTKGSHIVLDNPELLKAIGRNEFFFENRDGRIVLIYPLHDRVLVGTTDIPIDGPEEVDCTREEEEYFIAFIRYIFPDINIEPDQIVFRFSGIRPLPADTRSLPGQISRDHQIFPIEPSEVQPIPIFSLVGGKWTTFRAFSEQMTDVVLERMGKQRIMTTRNIEIGGGREYQANPGQREEWIARESERFNVSPRRVKGLFERYGTRTAALLASLSDGQETKLEHAPSYSREEISWLTKEEAAVRLEDILLRRTTLAVLGDLSLPLLEEIAGILALELDWEEPRKASEIQFAIKTLSDRHRVEVPLTDEGQRTRSPD